MINKLGGIKYKLGDSVKKENNLYLIIRPHNIKKEYFAIPYDMEEYDLKFEKAIWLKEKGLTKGKIKSLESDLRSYYIRYLKQAKRLDDLKIWNKLR